MKKLLVIVFSGVLLMGITGFVYHPFYVSVTNINFNKANNSLEINTKLFSDDFEKALKHEFGKPVNILLPENKSATDTLVKRYFAKHFRVTVGNKPVQLNYLGYERDEEGVQCYFEAEKIEEVKRLVVFVDLLYETHPEQATIIRSSVNGSKKNTRMANPVNQAILNF